jgi:hypothetical protein
MTLQEQRPLKGAERFNKETGYLLLAIFETSVVDFGYATATGRLSILVDDHSE